MKKFFSTLSSTLYGGVRGGLLFLALLTTSSLWAYDYDFERNEIRYKIISDEVGNRTVEVVGSYTNYATHFTIPKTVIHGAAAYEVIRIGDEAFDNHKTIAVIELPNSITSIGKSAFYNSTLKEITIPNSVTDIEESAFKSCTKLTSATLGNNVMTIGEDAFYNCTGLTSITIPNSVTTIGKYAFSGCSLLTSVTIPESVTNMSANPFSGCSAVTSIVWNAKKCTDPFNVLVFGDICTQITSFTFGDSVQHIPAYMCYGMNNLTSITIPNSVTSIGSSAFRDCTGLTSITIPNSVTSIGSNVFYGCSSLTSITIPNSVTSIGNYAFYNCSSLTSITIPNSVTSIGNYAFYNCSGLTSITIPNSVTSIGDYVFSGCSGLISIIVEDTNSTYDSRDNCNAIIKTATNTLIIGCKNTTIPNSVTSIGNNAFYGCSSLTSITIPNSVTSIGSNAFRHCTGLTSITIPNSVTSIGSSAFYGCSGLTSITSLAEIPPTLGSSVFYNVSTTIPVYVCAVSAYQSAEGWKAFTNIQELLVEYSIAVGVNDSIMGTAKVDYNTYCKGAQITATANQGYHFVQWSDGNTDNPRALVLTQDTAFTAEFAPNQYQLSLATNYSEMGSVQGAGTYDYLTEIEISATANYGYHFTQWNDGNTDNPRVVQVTEDMAYTAQFDKNIYTITTYCDNQMGSVSAPDSAEYLDEITISATANYGYHFVQWSDGNTDNPRALVLTQDTAFTAEFALTLSGQCGDNLYWAYDEDSKKISITGSGDMYNYTHSTQPWLFFQEQITEVTTSNTTSSIGTSAFEGCVRLGKVSLGYGMENIAAKAFAECKRLYDIYCYASYPPFAEQSSFANYNVYVYIPCEYQRDYTLDVVWGEFKFIECIGAKSDETGGDDIVITPGSTDVTITWPTENNADTYTIVIKKVGEVVCTLTFNADGQLLNIAFAPGREGNHPAQYAEAAANGYRFTVTGLEEATDYTYTITTKDASNKTINTHSGKFTTKSITAVDNTHSQSPMTNCQKTIRNGQLIIIRDGVEYDALGQEL